MKSFKEFIEEGIIDGYKPHPVDHAGEINKIKTAMVKHPSGDKKIEDSQHARIAKHQKELDKSK